jgi:hypothetical protein
VAMQGKRLYSFIKLPTQKQLVRFMVIYDSMYVCTSACSVPSNTECFSPHALACCIHSTCCAMILSTSSCILLNSIQTFAGPVFVFIMCKIFFYTAMTMTVTASNDNVLLAAHTCMLKIYFLFTAFGDSGGQTGMHYIGITSLF